VVVRELLHREVRFDENPRFLDWKPMYRVSRAALSRVTGVEPPELDRFFAELEPLHESLLMETRGAFAAGALMQAPLLYVLVRSLRPSRVVETGVSSGYSARFILEALERNGVGRLTSVGLDTLAIRSPEAASSARSTGRDVGWLVPARFSDRWHLSLGPTETALPQVLSGEKDPVDLFVHDSLHQYPTMMFEYRSAWRSLRAGGALASHDIHAGPAWPEFLEEKGLTRDEELDHDLGVVRVPT